MGAVIFRSTGPCAHAIILEAFTPG